MQSEDSRHWPERPLIQFKQSTNTDQIHLLPQSGLTSRLKSWQKSKPTLGWPRTTDSLCPNCVIEAREAILSGEKEVSVLINEKVGEIKAQIIERDGEIWMIKDCPIHGHFEDMMAIDSKFLTHIEKMFPGRDIDAHNDEKLHNHGSSTVKYGRGAVLTVDLTNRCNMMCDPCFMDANQVGFVHELSMEEIREILDNAISIKPRRQMSVQFSGGEPSISPHFIEAIKLFAEGWLQQCASRDKRNRVREEQRVLSRRLPKRVCVMSTFSSMESATTRIATDRLAICST